MIKDFKFLYRILNTRRQQSLIKKKKKTLNEKKKKALLKFSTLPTIVDVQELMGFGFSESFIKKLQLDQLESTKKYIEKLIPSYQ